jgi:MYXO-CTERM domain-containing protein
LSATVVPEMVGADAADLAITTDVNGATAATVQLSVVGISTALAVSPTSIDFGTTHTGSAAKPLTVTLSNLSSDAITLTDGVVIGMTPADFSVGAVAGTLAAGSSATATVSYDPAAAASSAATIDFGTSDATIPDAQVAITGRSVSTFLAANTTKLAFGSIEVGGDSGARLVTIENITTASLAIADVTAADAQFVVDASGVPATLAAGATAQLGVTFAPTRDGSAASTLAITLAGASTPELAIALTGDGASRPSVGGCSTGGDARWLVGVVVLGLALRRRRRR